jgi:hypothetical protein
MKYRTNGTTFDGREIKVAIADNRQGKLHSTSNASHGVQFCLANQGTRSKPIASAGIESSSFSAKLFVGSLAWSVSNDDLRAAFEEVGTVVETRLVMEKEEPTKSRGVCFCCAAL